MGRWEELAALARHQHLVVSVAQAATLGIPPRTVNDQLRERGWRRIHAGVYALAAAPDTFALRASAALLSAGERSVLSGSTAAWCWGLRRRPPGRVEILTPDDRRVRARDYVDVRRSATLSHATSPSSTACASPRRRAPWQTSPHGCHRRSSRTSS
ncbi:MAG: hypothetical protein M3O86_04880 [Actinomycetota bacterium]|nr:hypothetical protein [Actinomycetota bacterium]